MTELPSGTVTFLFTDVEGSTRLLQELGDAYADVLAEHRRVLRDAFARHDGVEVDTQGDAFFVAFSRASDAVDAAEEIQQTLIGPLRVRIGIHTGEPLVVDHGYVGIDVHRAARIAAVGHGGQTLLSQTTRDLVDDQSIRELGEHRLKDFAEPIRLFQIGRGEFPPIRTVRNSNLPATGDLLLGRERELADVLGLIRGGKRLVTLTGPGGIGKTRLALELAVGLTDDFRDGVWFVDLGALRDPSLVLPTIAATVGAKADVAEFLRERELLLVVDNFEGVALAAVDLGELLSAAPRVLALVASRERLRVVGEHEYPLRPLAKPPAVELFRQRAVAVAPDFEGDDFLLAEVCERLDFVPLAIELAAARMKLLTPDELLSRLESRLPLLGGGRRDAPARHRTLRATIDWSYELLSPDEQRLFARLGVFAGGITLAAAEAVCDADLDTLASLVDKSLVHRIERRFAMLETIREYALERLVEWGDEHAVRDRHARYFLGIAERLEPKRHDWAVAVEEFDPEVDNFRSALIALADDPVAKARLVVAVYPFWRARAFLTEARASVVDALGALGEDESPLCARLLDAASDLAGTQGDYDDAIRAADEAVAINERLDDPSGLALSLLLRGWWALQDGDVRSAGQIFERVVTLRPDLPFAWERLGVAALHEGDYSRASALFKETLAAYRRSDDLHGIRTAVLDLGLVAFAEGHAEEAERLFKEALELFVETDDTWGVSYCVEDIAAVAVRRDPERAAELLGWAEQVRRRLQHPLDAFEQRMHDATLAALRDELDEAALAESWDRGSHLTRDEAIERVRRSLPIA